MRSKQGSYSNLVALRALFTASLQGILKSPSAIVFGIAFPLIFILVFGFLGNGSGALKLRVAIPAGADTTSPLYAALRNNPSIALLPNATDSIIKKEMMEGDIVGSLRIQYQPQAMPEYHLQLLSASFQPQRTAQLREILRQTVLSADPQIAARSVDLVRIDEQTESVRQYKTIDFILPGQLGFSLLAGAVFGTAFIFLNLRQTLVLKRFFATPVRREVIVIAEALARLVFQMLTAVIIVTLGYYAFGFTLVHGLETFFAIMLLCMLATFVFMGFGFIISSIAKNDSTIPPLSNLVTLPQFLLAGAFFPISVFPKWLQPIANALPLTYLNNALRQVAFYGSGFGAIKWDVLALCLWGVGLYALAGKLFKWE